MYLVTVKIDSSAPANATHRLCVLDFKTPSDKKDDREYKKPASRCVSVPIISLEVVPEILKDALQDAFADMQDALIRTKFMAALESSKDGNPSVTILDSDISPAAVASYAAEKAISGKLSGEKIGAWFDAALADPLMLALANAMQYSDEVTPEQQAKLDAAIKQHRTYLAKLAGPAQLPPTLTKQLLQAVKLADDDKIKRQLQSKLETFLAPKEESIMLALGSE